MRCSDCGTILAGDGLPGDDGPVCDSCFADYEPTSAQELIGGVLLALAAYCVGVMLFTF